MKVSFKINGNTDKYTRFQVFIDDEPVGELQMPHEKALNFISLIVPNATIQ